MAKFCTRCGRRLEEGEVCSCMNPSGETMGQPAGESVSSKEGEAYKENYQNGSSMGGNPQEGYYQNDSSMGGNPQEGYYQNDPSMGGNPQGGYYQNDPSMGGNPQGGYYQNDPSMGGNPQGGYYQNGPSMGGNPQGGYYQNGPSMGGNPQGGYYQNGPSMGGNFQGGYYQNGPQMNGQSQAQWFGNKTEQFVHRTQNMFSHMFPLLGRPCTKLKELSETGSTAVGYELIIFHGVIATIISVISLAVLGHKLGGYIDMPYFQVILVTLLMVFGADFLEAVLMKATATIAGGTVSFGDMVLVMGQKSLISVFTSVLSIIFLGFAPLISLIIILLGNLTGSIYQVFGYHTVTVLEKDKVVFSYIVEKILLAVVLFAVMFVLYISLLGAFFDALRGAAGGFFF